MASACPGAEWSCRPELILGGLTREVLVQHCPAAKKIFPQKRGQGKTPIFPRSPIRSLYKEALGKGLLVLWRPQAYLVKGSVELF